MRTWPDHHNCDAMFLPAGNAGPLLPLPTAASQLAKQARNEEHDQGRCVACRQAAPEVARVSGSVGCCSRQLTTWLSPSRHARSRPPTCTCKLIEIHIQLVWCRACSFSGCGCGHQGNHSWRPAGNPLATCSPSRGSKLVGPREEKQPEKHVRFPAAPQRNKLGVRCKLLQPDGLLPSSRLIDDDRLQDL